MMNWRSNQRRLVTLALLGLGTMGLAVPSLASDLAVIQGERRSWQPLQRRLRPQGRFRSADVLAERSPVWVAVDRGGQTLPSRLPQPNLQAGAELQSALTRLPDIPQGVYWDGSREQFIYADEALSQDIQTIAAWFLWHPNQATNIVQAMPSAVTQRLRRNQNTSEAWTRVEPFDLVQGAITQHLFAEHGAEFQTYGVNRIVVTELVHRKLHRLLAMTQATDRRGAEIPSFTVVRSLKAQEVMVFCADRQGFAPRDLLDLGVLKRRSVSPFIQAIPLRMSEMTWLAPNVQLRCDGGDYRVRTEGSKKLSPPAGYNTRRFGPEAPVNVLVNFAIVDYVKPEMLNQITFFMQTIGYELEVQDAVQTTEAFSQGFVESDVFIPVAHSLNVNALRLGTGSSYRLVYRKQVTTTDGRQVPIRIMALFPKEGDTFKLPKDGGIAQLMAQRRQSKPYSMVIINASCHSDVNITPWMTFYEQSLALDQAQGRLRYFSDARDLPHIFASKRSFPTRKLTDMVTNFTHPLNAVEILAKGGTPRDVFTVLGEDAPELWQAGVREFWSAIASKGRNLYAKSDFDPVYNLSPEFGVQFHQPSDKVVVDYTHQGQTTSLHY